MKHRLGSVGAHFVVALVCAITGISCGLTSPSQGGCGGDADVTYDFDKPFTFPLPETAFIDSAVPAKAHFSWSHDFSGLCVDAPDSDNQAFFKVNFDPSKPPLSGVRIEGRVTTGAGLKPYTASSSFAGENFPVVTVAKIGLKQGHELDDEATVIAALELSFNSSGNIEQDRVAAETVVNRIYIVMEYRKLK